MSDTDIQTGQGEDDFHFVDTPGHPATEQLLAYWNSKCDEQNIPSRTDIRPSEIVSLLPNIIICDVLHNGDDYRVRIFGTALVDLVGEERTGKLISEFGTDCNPPTHAAAVRRRWMDSMQAAYRTRRPALVTGRMSSSRRSYIVWHGISCPLADKTQDSGTEATQIIGVMIAER